MTWFDENRSEQIIYGVTPYRQMATISTPGMLASMEKPRRAKTTNDSDKFIVRLPDGTRQRIAQLAMQNNRTMNAEIVMRLLHSLDASATGADASSRDRLAEAELDPTRLENLLGELVAQIDVQITWSKASAALAASLVATTDAHSSAVSKADKTLAEAVLRAHAGSIAHTLAVLEPPSEAADEPATARNRAGRRRS